MTNPEYLTKELDLQPFIERRFDTTLGCDRERAWLSHPERDINEVRYYRQLLSQDLATLAGMHEEGVSLNERHQEEVALACCNVLNFVISCNRLAQTNRLMLTLDIEQSHPLEQSSDPHYFKKVAEYEATTTTQDLLIHTRGSKDGRPVETLSRPIYNFLPDMVELKDSLLVFSKSLSGSSVAQDTTDTLIVGAPELELISFSDRHSLGSITYVEAASY